MSSYTIKWTSPSNTVLWLSGESYYTVLEEDAGWFMSGTNLILNYYQHHATVSRVRFEPRILTLPVLIQTGSQSEMDTAITALCDAFNPLSEAEGTLRVTRHDGVVREIKAIYWNGLEGKRSGDMYGKIWMKFEISLKCPNHAWYDPTPVEETYETGSPGLFFPIFPLQLYAGAIFGDTVVNNPGSMDSWPVWTITGPATNPQLINVTTGKSLKLTLIVLAGETLIIDTTPGVKSIKIGSVNKFNTTTVDSSLWPFVPGNQTIQVVLESTTTETQVDLEFYPRYISL